MKNDAAVPADDIASHSSQRCDVFLSLCEAHIIAEGNIIHEVYIAFRPAEHIIEKSKSYDLLFSCVYRSF